MGTDLLPLDTFYFIISIGCRVLPATVAERDILCHFSIAVLSIVQKCRVPRTPSPIDQDVRKRYTTCIQMLLRVIRPNWIPNCKCAKRGPRVPSTQVHNFVDVLPWQQEDTLPFVHLERYCNRSHEWILWRIEFVILLCKIIGVI